MSPIDCSDESCAVEEYLEKRRTLVFCWRAFDTKERYMSLLNISSCFTREFVATGRRITAFVDIDGFRDGIFTESFGGGIDSMFLDWGPALVTRWLN
jgi:hypothetical protein